MIVGALLASVGLILLNGVFVATEFALLASMRTRIEPMAEDGRFGAKRALEAMTSLGPMLAGTQLGITIASLALGSLAEPAVEHLLDRLGGVLGVPEGVTKVVALVLSLAVVVFLHLLFGEMVPKSIALAAPERTLAVLVLPVSFFAWVLRPVIVLLNALARLGARALGAEPADELRSSHTAAELAVMIEESEGEGLLDEEERDLLAGALDLMERSVDQVMVPRERIVSVERSVGAEEAEAAVRGSGHSRVLVTAGDLDHVLGFVHAKDLLHLDADARRAALPIRLRTHLVVDAGAALGDVLVLMQARRIHLATVTDDRGATVGLVTLEDILESLVGDIVDESDRDR